MLMRPTRVAAVICHALSPELSHDAYGFTASFPWLASPDGGPHNAVVRGVPGSSSRPTTSVSVENTSCFPWPGFGHVSRLLRREGGPAASGRDDFADVSARPIPPRHSARLSVRIAGGPAGKRKSRSGNGDEWELR